MKGKICLVTGANGGIGKATAMALAHLGATVVLAARNLAKGVETQNEIIAATGNSSIDLIAVDLSSQSSIRNLVAVFSKKYPKLDVLYNIAARYTSQHMLTPDGLELMFATNHLGPFLLTNLLLDKLRTAAPSRVLVVTAPSTTPLDFDNLQGEKHFNPLTAFGVSKMCNLLFTYELACKMEGDGVTVNAVHPGLVKSSLMQEAPFMLRSLTQLMSQKPEKPGRWLAYLAASPDVAGMTGKFFKDGKQINSNAYSHDPDVQSRLWEVSSALIAPG